MTPLVVISLCYLLITVPLSIVVRRMEARAGEGPLMTDAAAPDPHRRRDRRHRSCTSTSATTRCSRASTSTSTTARWSASIGPSGSGKSTLLRCVNLLEQPTSGRIFVEGDEITDPDVDVDAIRSRIGMVFQQFNLFPHLTVLRNLTIAQQRVKKPQQGRGRRGRPAQPREGRPGREGGRLPGPPLRRPAAAGRDRPGAVDGPRHDAVRRADQRPGPRAGRRRARRHEGPRLGGHDDDGRHPRDGLRPRGRRQAGLHGRRRHRRGGRRRARCSTTRSTSAPTRSCPRCSEADPVAVGRPSPRCRPRHSRPGARRTVRGMPCDYCGEEFDPIATRWLCPHCHMKANCCDGAPLAVTRGVAPRRPRPARSLRACRRPSPAGTRTRTPPRRPASCAGGTAAGGPSTYAPEGGRGGRGLAGDGADHRGRPAARRLVVARARLHRRHGHRRLSIGTCCTPAGAARGPATDRCLQERMLARSSAAATFSFSDVCATRMLDVYADHLAAPGRRPARARRLLLARPPALARRDPGQADVRAAGAAGAPRTARSRGAPSRRGSSSSSARATWCCRWHRHRLGRAVLRRPAPRRALLLRRRAHRPRRAAPDDPRPGRPDRGRHDPLSLARPRRVVGDPGRFVVIQVDRGAFANQARIDPNQARLDLEGQRLPRASCSRSIASNSALKLPLPKPSEPCRSMNS